jgi:hypothetical protein
VTAYEVIPSASVAPAGGRTENRTGTQPGRQLSELASAVFGNRTLRWTSEGHPGGRTEISEPAAGPAAPYLVVQSGTSFLERHPTARVVLDAGRYLAVDLFPEEMDAVTTAASTADFGITRLQPDAVAFRDEPTDRSALRRDPAEGALIAQVSTDRLDAAIRTLVAHHTRHSLQPGFKAAAEWAGGELSGWGYDVTYPSIAVGPDRSLNVVARKTGTGDRRLVIVTAHLDSVNHAQGPTAPAPGADDNASGSAGVLEIGRILANVECRHDLWLILFGGEEQGLFGSKAFVADLPTQDRQRLAGVVNMDMIGTLNGDGPPTVLVEGAPASQNLMSLIVEVAQTYTTLQVQTSLNPFASDHVPFIEAGMPALLTIEGSDSANHAVHTSGDVVERINVGFAADIVRTNLIAVSRLLGIAPARPPRSGSSPVVSRGPATLDVFAIGLDGEALHKWYGPPEE